MTMMMMTHHLFVSTLSVTTVDNNNTEIRKYSVITRSK